MHHMSSCFLHWKSIRYTTPRATRAQITDFVTITPAKTRNIPERLNGLGVLISRVRNFRGRTSFLCGCAADGGCGGLGPGVGRFLRRMSLSLCQLSGTAQQHPAGTAHSTLLSLGSINVSDLHMGQGSCGGNSLLGRSVSNTPRAWLFPQWASFVGGPRESGIGLHYNTTRCSRLSVRPFGWDESVTWISGVNVKLRPVNVGSRSLRGLLFSPPPTIRPAEGLQPKFSLIKTLYSKGQAGYTVPGGSHIMS